MIQFVSIGRKAIVSIASTEAFSARFGKRRKNMTAKEYLEQIENIDIRIKSLVMQERQLRNKKGDEKSLQELKDLIDDLREDSIKLQRKITIEIYSMKNNRYSALLAEKYLNGATWEQIAVSLEYSSAKYVRAVMFPRALAEFEKIL